MKLAHWTVGAVVVSLPLWAMALTRGAPENWSWVLSPGEMTCTSMDLDGCPNMYNDNMNRTTNIFADFNHDGLADWVAVDVSASYTDDDMAPLLEYELTISLITGDGSGLWDVGQSSVVFSGPCRDRLEYENDGGPDHDYVFDPNTIYMTVPSDTMPGESVGGFPIIFVVDVNGDQYPDLILEGHTFTVNQGNDDGWEYSYFDRYEAMYTFLNTGGTGFRCAGDLDGNGQTQVPDLLDLLEDWGCTSDGL